MKRWIYLTILTYVVPILNEGLQTEDVLFTQNNAIYLYHISSRNYSKITEVLHQAIDDMDYDFETQMMFFIVGKKNIYSMNLITKEVKVILTTDEMGLKNLQVDWITKKLYFSDIDTGRMKVSNFDGSIQRVILSGITQYILINLSPTNGLLFYTDIHNDQNILARVNMDGSDRRILINGNNIWPTVLTVDSTSKTVYWYNFMTTMIEKVSINGSNRQTFYQAKNIHVMALVGLRLFYSELSQTSITSCNIRGRNLSNCVTEVDGLQSVNSVRSYGKLSQPFLNSGCHIKNGGCSHLCLLRQNGYSCGCPTGIKLLSDKHSCAREREKFLLLSIKSGLRIIYLDADEGMDVRLPFKKRGIIQGVDYDPVSRMIYWADSSEDGYVMRAHLNESRSEIVIPDGFTLPDTPAVDWVARNLYWTCSKFKKIYVSRLDGSAHTVIIDSNLKEPRGLAVDPTEGRLYWSDWGDEAKIEAADLDGKNRVVLVNTSLKWPNGISLDYQNQRLYWCDGGKGGLEFYDLRHKTRHKLGEEAISTHPYGVSVMGDYIYWTDWMRTLYQFNLVTKKRKILMHSVADIMDVKAIDTNMKHGSNPCQLNNYNCSHFCFHKSSGTPVCGCPDGYTLDETLKSCLPITGFILYSTGSYINLLPLDPSLVSSVPKKKGHVISHVAALSRKHQIIWVENTHDGGHAKIKTGLINNTDQDSVIQKGFYKAIGGFDVDFISENIYWSQRNLNRIEVSRIDGRFRKTLVHTEKKGVKSTLLSVNPVIRKLYWFEVQGIHSCLLESNLNGSSQRVIKNITGEVTGLAVDVNDSRIYYISKMSFHNIESIDLNGKDHRVVVSSLGTSVGLTVFRDRLYFCELEREDSVVSAISSVKKQDGSGMKKLKEEVAWFHDVAALYDRLDAGENICDQNNGGCEHLCFATAVGARSCMCENHYKLSIDNTSCIGPKKFVLLSEKSVIYRVSLQEQEAEVPLHIPFEISVNSIGYNIQTATVYWLDERTNEIKFPSRDVNKTVDLGIEGGKPISFAIDFFTNTLYWIDKNNHTIHFVNLYDRQKSGVIFDNKKYHPTKLIVLPERGLVFFINTFLSRNNHGADSIESMNMDGSNVKRLHLFNEKDIPKRLRQTQPNTVVKPTYDIAVDQKSNRLFWVHMTEYRIYSMDFNGQKKRERVAFHGNEYKAKAIAVHENLLYWVDNEIKTAREKLKRSELHHLEQNRKISYFPRIYELVNDILVVDFTRMEVDNPCKIDNGGCSHVCYSTLTKSGHTVTQCGCPLGYVLPYGNTTHCTVRDRKTCPVVCNNQCQVPTTHCSEITECEIGLTESDCTCREKEFRCVRGNCVPASAMCDGTFHCVNGEDEDERSCRIFFNSTKDKISTLTPTKTVKIHDEGSEYSYTAGIISGALVTTLIFVCVLYIVCMRHHKRMRLLNKDQNLQTKYTVSEEPVIFFPSIGDRQKSVAESLISTGVTLAPNFDLRYITGSSTAVADSVLLPLNPPPSVMSSEMTLSRRADDYNSNYYDERELPVPPATPLYMPSDVESILTDNEKVASIKPKVQQPPQCIYCQKESCGYMSQTSSTDGVSCVNPPSLASSYISSNRKPFYRSHRYISLETLNSQPLTRKLSYLTSIADTVGNEERILPSPASEASFSRYASEESVVTVRELKNSEDEDGFSSSANFCSYAPPPSPGTEYASDMNDFQEFRHDEEEAFEVDFLLDSHRSVSMESGLF
ncbi:low-density lipoprotein receptor-related protein 6-like isoform X2 [Hydractinia symbiolongicarpus]|uniref:low-density lipoprotein receptor-related protein 6-like isoform X2 n=1 Tax=Hydractinia symbiolongicarpus TaxID=13093 RepID=UPI002549C97B|nr:low-density lipoprotein receptor-related protein 6-like isoform X2 [Hydractinia symbiolongicarpus]